MGTIGGIILILVIKIFLDKEKKMKQREHIAELKRKGGLLNWK